MAELEGGEMMAELERSAEVEEVDKVEEWNMATLAAAAGVVGYMGNVIVVVYST